ncbi:MAG TPA: DUF971 domain-containing protein [Rhodocyclaceae bacterium]|jgi:DUF971 family protein|nr:DUF971 domain-containing protein [Rhodocyclaceae bacterium]
MSGLDRNTPIPTELKLHNTSRILEVSFDDGSHYRLSYEFLRVFSPSAEVRGHGVGQGVLQTGKREVTITDVEPVGNYAVKISFSDGHNSGLYSWDVLHTLGSQQEALWQDYLKQLEAAGASRDVDTSTPKPTGHSCSKH